jgi:glutathione S-transferase
MSLHLVIGNKNYSSWSFRPWLAMKVAGITFDETVGSLDAADFKTRVTALGGAGRVPVLRDGDVRVRNRWRSWNISPKNFPPPDCGPSALRRERTLARLHQRCMPDLFRCGVTCR